MSATYRQSSVVSAESLKTDPENIYLSHAPRLRVKAEFIRDMVLETSGLLVKKIGGPSVKRYQPKGLWEMATSGRGVLATYKQDKGENLYRRGMYTFIKLTVPPPSMILMDASNRDHCEATRSRTNTPLHALMMMNDPTVLEASRVFAQRLVEKRGTTDEKLQYVFKRIICRKPTTAEFSILKEYYSSQLQKFNTGKLDAAATLQVGEFAQNTKLNKNEVAALMKVINLVYNMEEAVTKT